MKNSMQRFLSFMLALVLVVGLLPVSGFTAYATEADSEPDAHLDAETGLESMDKVGFGELTVEDFAGKKVSILGDSISTYRGVSNNTDYNSTIKNNAVYYYDGKVEDVKVGDTWWQQVIDVLDMELCVNNSWSGSAVFGPRAGQAAYIDRCVQLHNDNTGEEPDVILIYMGTNDYSHYNANWGAATDIIFPELIIREENGTYSYTTPETVIESYAIMLHKIQQRYPDALIYGLGLLARGSANAGITTANNELKAIMKHFKVPYVELETLTDTSEEHSANMFDSLHPKAKGMDEITKRVLSTMLGKEQALYDVAYDLQNAICDNSSNLALAGESYEANLTVAEGYDILTVTVTMGGMDVTNSVYSNGKIYIEEVTGAIEIFAAGGFDVPTEPEIKTGYRWENVNGTMVSATGENLAVNALTKNSTYGYKMAEPVVLKYTENWAIEFAVPYGGAKSMPLSESGSPSNGFYLFYPGSESNGRIYFGARTGSAYLNMGCDVAPVSNTTNTYRFLNQYDEGTDTNTIWVSVNGGVPTKMDTMYHSHSANGVDQTVTHQKKDITFGYLGASSFPWRNDITYLQIWTEVAAHEHSFGEWYLNDEGNLQRDCVCGESETEELKSYRWENVDGAMVSVTGEDFTENPLTVNGTSGYKMTYPAVLKYNESWAIEFAVPEGGNKTMVLSETGGSGSGFYLFYPDSDGYDRLYFGKNTFIESLNATKYLNMGCNLQVNKNALNKYRIVNLYDADSDMNSIWVSVNDAAPVEMNTMYHANSSSGVDQTVTHLKKDFNFGFLGTSGFAWRNDTTYLQIWPKDTVHVHAYGDWYVNDEDKMQRECLCGESETRELVTFRWENVDGTMVSATGETVTENPLVKNGSVGYKMTYPAELDYTKNWEIEFTTKISKDTMPLSETGSAGDGMFFYLASQHNRLYLGSSINGTYVNAGPAVVSNIITGGENKFRVMNRYDEKTGTNMMWLSINDGEKVQMNNLYHANGSQRKTTDIYLGKNLQFQYLGAGGSFTLDPTISYLQIWLPEISHIHHFGEWEIVEGELRRTCDQCDEYEVKPLNTYRWELNEEKNALVSVATDGYTQNDLTAYGSGTITDGEFKNVAYRMAEPVLLKSDAAWVVEWKSSGQDDSAIILSNSVGMGADTQYVYRNQNGLWAIGYASSSEGSTVYNNYGLLQDIDAGTHVYRMENRVAEDGSNMVYFLIDGVEIGPMNRYFISTAAAEGDGNWLNGQDLSFSTIGASGNFTLTGMNFEYLQIWMNNTEHMHVFIKGEQVKGNCIEKGYINCECACGETYKMYDAVFGAHKPGEWTVVDDMRQANCELCGELISAPFGTQFDSSITDGYYNVISQKNFILCDGVTESEVVINNNDASRRQVLHVLEVDPSNPNVEVLPSYYGIDKDMTNSDNWSAHIMEEQMDYYRDNLDYNVVAGMNTGLTYDSDAPMAFLVYNGQVIAEPTGVHSTTAGGYLAVMKNDDGTVYFELRNSSEQLHGDEWQAIPTNNGLIVRNGELVRQNVERGTGADRSMIGVKADGTLVIVQNEGRNAPYSVGFSTYEEGEAMLALGCVWALNGDGGGSSQILTKREGESDYSLRNIPSDGTPRATINGIIFASKAKADGVFDHASLLVEHEYITPGNSVNIDVKGVDGSGMPADLPEGIIYEATGGTVSEGVFTSDGTVGEQVITAYHDGKEIGSVSVNVVVPTSISFDNAVLAVPFGKTVDIPVSAYYGNLPVAICAADLEFKLSAEIGVVEGLTFHAPAGDGSMEERTADLTATLTHNKELSVMIPVYIGKGSEVLYDFEDQDLHGWYRSTAAQYNAIQVGGETYLVDASTGHVRNGDYAMAVELDFSNSIEPGFLLGTLRCSELVVLENAQAIGMWVYLPDEAEAMRIDTQIPIYASKELPVGTGWLTPAASVSEAGETDIAEVGFISAYDESGWHYIYMDLSSEEFTGLPVLKFYVSMKDGKNGYVYGEYPNANGNYVLYVDDITVDYSQAVDDREAPVFSSMTYIPNGVGDPLVLDGNTVDTNTVSFSTTVVDNMGKNNYTGLDKSSARAYIDGVDYTNSLTVTGKDRLVLSLENVTLSNGNHNVKFVICDNMGNRSAIARSIVVGSSDSANIRVVAHDPDAERILLGSLYYIDVVADNPETVSSVTVTLDLNNISVWELDHMEVAKGFEATYSLIADEDIATVTINANGKTNLSGEDQILVSIPVRTWELPIVEPIYGHDDRVYMYDSYKATDSILPMGLYVDVDGGSVIYKDGSGHSFSGPRVEVTTEHSGNGYTSSGSAALNYIGDEPWYADWNGGHDHRPETKQYYLEGSTNHVDPVSLEDMAPTCDKPGYTGRTYCEVCESVVDWGTTLEATGHNYEFVDGLLKCECGELFNGIFTDGKAYIDGVVSDVNGWFDDSYFVDGVALTGVHKVPSPSDPETEYYYDFGEKGVCRNKVKYTGMFQDGDVYRYAYIGELTSGWHSVQESWYYFSPETMANVSGKYTIDGLVFEFEDDGKLVTGVWEGRRYWYGPSYYEEFWYEIDGKLYYFEEGYAQSGVHYVRKYGYLERVWAEFDENCIFVGYLEGFITDDEGHLLYYVEGLPQIGLHKIDGEYYFFNYNTGAVKGVKYAWETHCDLPLGEYEFGEDFKMLNGIEQKEDGLYYYINGKPAPSGLTKLGEDYYFVGGYGKLRTGRVFAWETLCDLPKDKEYTFGADGKMLNGIVELDDGVYYYVVGQPGPQGLTKVGNDYYFVGDQSKCATGEKYCWATNCDLPIGTYTFGEDGKMIDPPGAYMRGDLDNNGTVDDEDVIYLLWHTLMSDDYPVNQPVDFDSNGVVDDEDVIYLLWHTLMPKDYPL